MSNLYRTAQPVLPPPHVAGVPADPATLEAYRRTLAMRMLPRFANQIAGPVGRPDVGAANDTLVAALAARTSLLLGLEIRAADALSMLPATTGQLTDPGLSSRDLAQQALWRFNAVFGPLLTRSRKTCGAEDQPVGSSMCCLPWPRRWLSRDGSRNRPSGY